MTNEKQIHLRNASLEDLLKELNKLEAQKFDIVVPSTKMYCEEGVLHLSDRNETFVPTYSMKSQVASKLGIPFDYFKRMQNETPDLYDVSINEWLSVKDSSYLIRSYLDDHGGHAVGRAMLSDRYKVIDNNIILKSILKTIMDNNINASVKGADIDERRMTIRFEFPDVQVKGGAMTENYRNPVNKQVGDTVAGGFTLTNSETGFGSLQLLPRLEILICSNGWTRSETKMKRTHLGGKMDDGLVKYSENTHEKNLELIMSQMQDFVTEISTIEYLQDWVDHINDKVKEEIENPTKVIPAISKELGVKEDDHEDILNYFTKSGDTTINGAVQALNFYAHQQKDPEVQYDIERNLDKAVELIPTLNK